MSIFDSLVYMLADEITKRLEVQNKPLERARHYRIGRQKPQLIVEGRYDDNILANFCGLIVDRGVSQMLGDGVTFDLPGDGPTPESQYIDGLWEANHSAILLTRAALVAADAGTGYIKILPNGVVGKGGVVYPRLVVVDPEFVTMDTAPEDGELVIRYIIQYTLKIGDKEIARRQVIEHEAPAVAEDGTQTGGDNWTITDYEYRGSKWEEIGATPWPYNFAPIIHWQNLPVVSGPYGEPDLTEDMLELQDKLNFVASNMNKLIRFYAMPMRYTTGMTESIPNANPGNVISLSDPDGKIVQLDQLGDLASSQAFLRWLRQALFDISRSVDIDSVQDKLGSLTNFGLKVMYQDALHKIETKRELFGEALEELNRRLLIIGGFGEDADPGEVVWPDVLPVNEAEQVAQVTGALNAGLVSKQTASESLGYTWETEQERMQGEQAASQTAQNNIGSALLSAFNRGNPVGGPVA